MLSYNNEVSNSEGRFWYELISFENGEPTVTASNEAVYEVADLKQLEGQELSAEYIEAVEQVKLVKEELQHYLNSNWVKNILLNALSDPDECYLYQDEVRRWGDAFEVFAVQSEGTGLELKIEDFFYPYSEGITVLPEDARERVLSGEVLYLDVSEENAMAGNIDLDGDGTTERIYLEALEKYEKTYSQVLVSYFEGDYRIRVNDVYYLEHGLRVMGQVMLYSPDGETILLAVYDDGPSGDPTTIFYRYDAEKQQVIPAGEIETDLHDAEIENGVIKGRFRADMIETQFAIGYWIWSGEKIILREDDIYEYGLYTTRIGENGEEWEDGYMRLKETLTVYAERSEESKSFTMNPQKVLCVSSDLKEWIYLVAEDGTEGWLRVEEYARIPSLGNKESSEVFDGLGFAG